MCSDDKIIAGGCGIIVAIILGVLCLVFYPSVFGNKAVADFSQTFNYADVAIGNSVKTYEIKKWTDYEGEQIQIWTKDGNVLLVSSLNTVLRKN